MKSSKSEVISIKERMKKFNEERENKDVGKEKLENENKNICQGNVCKI